MRTPPVWTKDSIISKQPPSPVRTAASPLRWLVLAILFIGFILVCAPMASAANLDAMRQRAEHGDADAQEMLGSFYSAGLGVAKDDAQAVVWLEKAAGQGRPGAEFSLGEMYANGRGAPKDTDKAVDLYRKAAEQGYARARGALRKMYVEGKLVPVADSQAGSWWRKLVAQAETEVREFSQARAAAEGGNADAQVKVGILYLTGVGTPKDRGKAATWFGMAAEQGQSEGQCILAALNAANTAWHVASENSHAVDSCRRAADQGYADAQVILAVHYAMGRGVLKDPAEAEVWWRKAAGQGRADAEAHVAGRYQIGDGVPKDTSQSVSWYLKAAEQGNPDAVFQLSLQASISKLSGESIQIPSTIDGLSLSDFAAEHRADSERDFLPNLWASPLNKTETRDAPIWRTRPMIAAEVVFSLLVLGSFLATWAWGWRAAIPALAVGPILAIAMCTVGYFLHRPPSLAMVRMVGWVTGLWWLAAIPAVALAFTLRAVVRGKRLA
jgi:TPR repeat protein